MASSLPAELVILCAGRSSRLGEPKGLFALGGRPWLMHQLDAASAVGLARPWVVLGFDEERYRQRMPSLWERAEVVRNPEPERGPFSSLRCALARVSPNRAVFVLPVDVPLAGPEVIRALRSALTPEVDAVVPRHAGRGGHPVLLSAASAAWLCTLACDARLDVCLQTLSTRRIAVDDPRVRLNLNTRADFQLLLDAS